ncbi:hypothetical protein EJP82_01360 [Paenibacillus anaericanus]|uniref:Uncharacterized protein n=1 Tax=Paenibacillus anaericanus TaxID=170367 RepID=A0A433YFH9_9BACL|nr:hypothetical protein [Paenibacillus anaericanus]RUT48617.1 hypothetical protein EJP82_01360 [Paenibacillus anaericanus]
MVDVLLDLVKKSSVTDWIQALGSIAAIFIAYVSLVVSKRAIDTGVITQLRVTRVTFNLETSSGPEFVVMVANSGHSDAFEIKVQGYFIKNVQRVNVMEKSYKYYDTIKLDLIGRTEMKSGDTCVYSITQDSYFSFDAKTSLILTYELASGTVIKRYWKFNADRSKTDDRFVKMTPFEIKKFKIHRAWLNIKHPFVIIHKSLIFKKRKN